MTDDRRPPTFFDLTTAKFLATVSGLFCMLLTVGMLWHMFSYKGVDYFDAKEFEALKQQVYDGDMAPDTLKTVREEDARRRAEFLESQMKIRAGVRLLLIGMGVFVLSLRRIRTLRWRPPQPIPLPTGKDGPDARRKAVITTFSALVPIAAFLLLAFALFLPKEATSEAPSADQSLVITLNEDPPSPVSEDQKWPGFRGPTGMGIVEDRGFPREWNADTGDGVAWKIEVPSPGNSSPVIWGDRLFLTGADDASRRVHCFDVKNGALLWSKPIRTQAALEHIETYQDTGLASPTPATDGTRVYAFFGTNEMAAFDFEGNQVWSRWFGEPDSMYGISTSPVLHNETLILQLDQGAEGEGKSFLYGINTENGNIRWKTPRDVPGSWSSPIIIDSTGRKELITCAKPWVIAYNPVDGREYWRAKVLAGDVAPLPVYADGIVYTTNDGAWLSALRTGGLGDVTDTHLLWQTDEMGLPDVASPVTDGDLLLQIATWGPISCVDAQTGELHWEEYPESGIWSSPTLVGDSIYMTDQEGKTFIYPLADSYNVSSTATVGEKVVTTPAFVEKSIYIRGETHLFRIGNEP